MLYVLRFTSRLYFANKACAAAHGTMAAALKVSYSAPLPYLPLPTPRLTFFSPPPRHALRTSSGLYQNSVNIVVMVTV